MKKVIIIDTSILCAFLNVPGKETCGPAGDTWNQQRAETTFADEEDAGTTFVLPLTSIIETGNHISQVRGDRYSYARSLAAIILKTANEETPWAAFSRQSSLWSPEKLKILAETWPELASQKISLGDATIKDVAELYQGLNFKVEILTADRGLKAWEPEQPREVPRRRQKR